MYGALNTQPGRDSGKVAGRTGSRFPEKEEENPPSSDGTSGRVEGSANGSVLKTPSLCWKKKGWSMPVTE